MRKKRKIKVAKQMIKDEIVDILQKNDSEMIDHGVSLDIIIQQLSEISLPETIDAIEELQKECIIYSTCDDNHFKLM